MNEEQKNIVDEINKANLLAIKKINNSSLRKTLFSIVGIFLIAAFTVYFTAIKDITANTINIGVHESNIKEKVSGGVFIQYCTLIEEKWEYLKEGQEKNEKEIKEVNKKIEDLIKEYKLVKRNLSVINNETCTTSTK